MNDLAAYLDSRGLPDRLSGGARRLPIDTLAGRYFVWTKRIGNNPRLKVEINLSSLEKAPPGAGVWLLGLGLP